MALSRFHSGALLVVLVVASAPASGVAKTSKAKAGGPCTVEGQIGGKGPAPLLCQRSAKNRLVWRAAPGTPVTAPQNSQPSAGSSFVSRPSPDSVTGALALYNAQGAAGYAYVGPFFVGGMSREIFVKAETATYTYDAVEKGQDLSSSAGLLALFTAKGKQGFVFKGPVVFGADPSKSYLLFVKSSARNTTYSYRSSDKIADEASMTKILGANGSEGFAYAGDLVADISDPTSGFALFVKDDTSRATYSYLLKPSLNDRAQLLAEINATGVDRFSWKGTYGLGLGTSEPVIRSLYEKSSLTQSATSCAFGSPSSTVDGLITAANEQAKNGKLFWGDFQVGTETVSVFCALPLRTVPLLGVVFP